jgi:hypothetical protein
MQPHSISALAVAKHVFANNYGEKIPKSAEVQIDWTTPEGRSRSIFHFISAIEISKTDSHGYITELKVSVRTTDGTSCTLTIRRQSDGAFKQGEKLVATHSVQHVAGLEEQYELGRKFIRGVHRNSRKYGNFVCTDANEGAFVLDCMVRIGSTNNFKRIPYKVKVRPTGEEMTEKILQKKLEEARKKEESYQKAA